MSHWVSINFTEAQLHPRWLPAVSMLNSQEIVIMGGNGFVDDEYTSLGDVLLFDQQTEQITKKVQNFAGLLQFQAVGNKCVQYEEDTVVALVEDEA